MTEAHLNGDLPDREMNLFVRESTAYRRLKAKGFFGRGLVPDFYGTITNIQATLWPDLHMFVEDKLPPNAILIEHIPGAEPLSLGNYSKCRLDELRKILHEFHDIGILHGDPKPRNMMVSSGDLDRVLWIDFDSARVFSEDSLSPKQENLIKKKERDNGLFCREFGR
jgi:serine/threonine protein kinase